MDQKEALNKNCIQCITIALGKNMSMTCELSLAFYLYHNCPHHERQIYFYSRSIIKQETVWTFMTCDFCLGGQAKIDRKYKTEVSVQIPQLPNRCRFGETGKCYYNLVYDVCIHFSYSGSNVH